MRMQKMKKQVFLDRIKRELKEKEDASQARKKAAAA